MWTWNWGIICFFTVFLGNNLLPTIIKEFLRHQDVKTTQIYSHLRSEDSRNAINILNDKENYIK